METTLENPVIKDDAAIDQAFMEAASAADKGEKFSLPSSAEQPEPRTPGTTETASTSNTDTQPEKKDERPRDELGRFTTREDGTDIPEAERTPGTDPAPEPKPKVEAAPKEESAFAKAQKERDRQQSVLKNFEVEKETTRREFEQERQRIAQEWQRVEQQRQQSQNGDKPKFTAPAEDYGKFTLESANKLRELAAAGDYDALAEQAELTAKAAVKTLQARDHELVQEQEHIARHFQGSFVQEMQALRSKDPELDNPESELGKEVVAVMGAYPIFERIPPVQMPDGTMRGGFWLASEAAKLRVENKKNAGRVSVLETQLKQITAERDDLRVRTGIGGSSPTGPVPSKRIEDMSDAESEEYFAREASKYDSR